MSGSKEHIRSIRCDFSPEEYDAIKAAAAADDRNMKRFCERAILMAASMPDTRLGMVKSLTSASSGK